MVVYNNSRKQQIGLDARKPVFRVLDRVWTKPVCSASKTSMNSEMCRDIIFPTMLYV